jgi:type II secretory pathway pseudopilin PulG
MHTKRGRRTAFTLVELLVVIGIIVALIALLLPSVMRAMKIGERTRLQADLQTIATALTAYQHDHGDFPRVTGGQLGATVLCRALLGPYPETDPGGILQDGANGFGFRTRPSVGGVPQGRVWGPYLDPAKWKVAQSTTGRRELEIVDRFNEQPILYYPANRASNIYLPNGYVAAGDYPTSTSSNKILPRFNANDNSGYMPINTLQVLLGDVNKDGGINNGEQPAFDGDFLLWATGPDGRFGPNDPTKPVSSKNRCDDVANFPRSEY